MLSSHLIQQWVDCIVENIRHADKEAVSMDKLRMFMDPLVCQLLALSESSLGLQHFPYLRYGF